MLECDAQIMADGLRSTYHDASLWKQQTAKLCLPLCVAQSGIIQELAQTAGMTHKQCNEGGTISNHGASKRKKQLQHVAKPKRTRCTKHMQTLLSPLCHSDNSDSPTLDVWLEVESEAGMTSPQKTQNAGSRDVCSAENEARRGTGTGHACLL